MRIPRQFEIFQVNLEPILGSEQGGQRPCLILQTNAANIYARTFLIAPFTSKKTDFIHSNEVLIYKSRENGLNQDSKLKIGQLRVVDKVRLIKRLGRLECNYEPAVFQIIDIIFDRFGDFRKS